jgi:phage replication O-like protein O
LENPYKEKSQVDPQTDGGFRQINNQTYWALMAARLTGAEYQVIFSVIDRTWGYKAKEDSISFSDLARDTQLSRASVITAAQALEAKHIIVVEHAHGRESNLYMFNKYWDTWLICDNFHPTSKANRTSQVNSTSKANRTSQVNSTSQGSSLATLKPEAKKSTSTVLLTSQVPTPEVEPVKKGGGGEGKETIKEILLLQLETENELSKISNLYQENIGILTPMIADELKDIAATYPAGWFEEALKEAVGAGVRKLKYVSAILERWRAEGFKSQKGGSKHEYERRKGVRPKPDQERIRPITYISGRGLPEDNP